MIDRVGWCHSAVLQRPPTPTQQETIEELLARSKRNAVPIRWSFVQRGTRMRPQPGPLADFVHCHDERALDLYLLAHAAASAAPWNVDLPAGVWARMLGLHSPGGPSAISKAWKRLENRGLIDRARVQRRASITLLREDGDGDPYTHPGAGPKSAGEPYLKLPYAYWEDGWYQRLRLSGKAMLLIALSLENDFILPEDKAKPWYGISADFAGDGARPQEAGGAHQEDRLPQFAPDRDRVDRGAFLHAPAPVRTPRAKPPGRQGPAERRVRTRSRCR